MHRSSCRQAASAAARLAAGVALSAVLAAPCAVAQEPRVPYVPTPQEVVDRMLEIAKVGPYDYLIDLGSGDGRIVVTAAKKFGARGFGVDLNPVRIQEANDNARKAGVTDKIAFYQRDLFETDLDSATVITMYLLPQVNLELRPKLLKLKPGTRLVSHDFDMGDWKPDTHVTVNAKDKYGGSGGTSDVYYWIVPAAAGGVWQWELPATGKALNYELKLEQKYQAISGTVSVGGSTAKITNARLRGEEIRFAFTVNVNGQAVRHEFNGRINGDSVTGSALLSGPRVQGQHDWDARRSAGAGTGRDGARLRYARSAHGAFH
ncbi:MAG TPA: class I SAM-dependent methyltransferase [Burkholderiales bacterium]|nr:class I SAM-dependent methyltransferase [Burkholderiales bacterium]